MLKKVDFSAKSYAKVNLFLKIVGRSEINGVCYHLLHSRFVKVESLFDVLRFDFSANDFSISGNFDCQMQQNTIYKAYLALLPHLSNKQKESLKHLSIFVDKKIPSGGGLGGGSSNAATFLLTLNKQLDLKLSEDLLLEISASVGSDVPFFISGFECANVSGRGEIIEPFVPLNAQLEIIDSKVYCSTKEVFSEYAKHFYNESKIKENLAQNWLSKSNEQILSGNPLLNNDLLEPLLKLHPNLSEFARDNFLSGSGGCFWRIRGIK